MTKKSFLGILAFSVFLVWMSGNRVYTSSFTQNGIQTGFPFNYYFCPKLGNCFTSYSLFGKNILIVFIVSSLVYKLVYKKKK